MFITHPRQANTVTVTTGTCTWIQFHMKEVCNFCSFGHPCHWQTSKPLETIFTWMLSWVHYICMQRGGGGLQFDERKMRIFFFFNQHVTSSTKRDQVGVQGIPDQDVKDSNPGWENNLLPLLWLGGGGGAGAKIWLLWYWIWKDRERRRRRSSVCYE